MVTASEADLCGPHVPVESSVSVTMFTVSDMIRQELCALYVLELLARVHAHHIVSESGRLETCVKQDVIVRDVCVM